MDEFFHSFFILATKLLIDVGGRQFILSFMNAQTFSIGLQSGDCDGQGNNSMPLSTLNALLIFYLCLGSLSSNSFQSLLFSPNHFLLMVRVHSWKYCTLGLNLMFV